MEDNDDDGLERHQLPPELQPQLRLYRRLWLARSDLAEALAVVDEIIRARIPVPRRKRPPPLLIGLTVALVVSYARPWVHSRGQSFADKTVPASMLRCLTSRQRAVHEFLVDMRNKEVAHSDADVSELYLRLIDGGDVGILRNSRAPFPKVALLDIRRVIVKLQKAMDMKCEELRLELPNQVWL